MKSEAEAIVKLQSILSDGYTLISMAKTPYGYQVTTQASYGPAFHIHYEGDTLLEAIMKIKI